MTGKNPKIQEIIDVIKNAKDFVLENNISDIHLQPEVNEAEVDECDFKIIFSLLMLKRFSEMREFITI